MKLRDIIIEYRTEHNLSQREFAAKCKNITNGYISMIEADMNNHTGKPPNPSMKKLESIAHGMGMELDELLEKMNGKKKLQLIPSPRVETLEHMSSVLEDMINEQVSERINEHIRRGAIPGLDTMPYTPPRTMVPIIGSVRCGSGGLALEEPQGYEGADVANAEDYFWLRATGDSMEPDVREGDLVLIHKQPEVESGELAVVVVDGEEGMLKRVILKPGAVILQSANPAHPPRVFIGAEAQSVRIAGKAVQMVRKW